MPSDGSTGAVFRYIGGTNNPGLFFSTNESTTDCVINATGSTSANLVFSTTSERMRIDSSGNVGVGLTDPDEKLEIFGDVKIGQSGGSGVLHFGNASDKTKIIGRDNAHSSLPNTLGIFTDNAERMTFDASGNVGIGTSSPDRPLDITDTTSDGSGGAVIHSYLPTLELDDISGGGTSFILQHDGTSTLFKHDTTERMRIDSSGYLLVGTTASSSSGTGRITAKGLANGSIYTIVSDQSAYGSGTIGHIRFLNSNGAVGQIQTSGSSTSYNTSSDYRLKENVVELTGATERLKQLNPSRFNFITDADTTVDGFLAHEVADVVPEAISGEKDAVDADGNPEYQGIDQSKLVPLLVATIQELEARITQLENN
jgi:hypothetical protein